jgi:hypothetical protein
VRVVIEPKIAVRIGSGGHVPSHPHPPRPVEVAPALEHLHLREYGSHGVSRAIGGSVIHKENLHLKF